MSVCGDLLHEMADATAWKTPDAPAFRFGAADLTFEELATASDRLASVLIESGVRRGDRVGIYLNKSLETAISVYGVMKAGAAYVPLDPGASPERTRIVMRQCELSALITHQPKAAATQEIMEGYDGAALACIVGVGESVRNVAQYVSWEEARAANRREPPNLLGADLSYIIFTSGSTGAPKGIMHTHDSGKAYANAAARIYDVKAGDRLSNHSPLHFDMSTFDYFCAPLTGACTVIIPEGYAKLPASLSRLIEKERLTHWYSAPFALVQLQQHGVLDQRDLSSLRWVMFGGEPFPAKYLSALMQQWPQARFSNVYGPAEVNQCTYHHVTPEDLADDQPPPIGAVWAEAEGKIVDAEDKVVTSGESGELLVRSGTMMRGYWGRPDLNERAFFERPVTEGIADRFYRTGDIVRADENGVLTFLGRKDRQVKLRGFRIELDEIEAALSSHEAVDEAAAVIIVTNDEKKLVAAYTLRKGATAPSDEELRAFLARRLPHYAVPTGVFASEEFPRTTTEKIDRRLLTARLQYLVTSEASHER